MEDAPKTMTEIIDGLQRAHSAALPELQSFEEALSEMWRNLTPLNTLVKEVVQELDSNQSQIAPAVFQSIRDRAERAATAHEQVINSFEMICRAIREWGIAPRGPSNRPRSVLETPPPARSAEQDLEDP